MRDEKGEQHLTQLEEKDFHFLLDRVFFDSEDNMTYKVTHYLLPSRCLFMSSISMQVFKIITTKDRFIAGKCFEVDPTSGARVSKGETHTFHCKDIESMLIEK